MGTVPATASPRRYATVGALILAAVCAVVAVRSDDDPPPEVIWFPSPGCGVAASPGGSELAFEVVDHVLDSEDRFSIGVTLVPTRSGFARWLERVVDRARFSSTGRGSFYWRCAPVPVDGPAAYAFTGLSGGEAAEIWGTETMPLRAFRDRARDRVGAERFDELAKRR